VHVHINVFSKQHCIFTQIVYFHANFIQIMYSQAKKQLHAFTQTVHCHTKCVLSSQFIYFHNCVFTCSLCITKL